MDASFLRGRGCPPVMTKPQALAGTYVCIIRLRAYGCATSRPPPSEAAYWAVAHVQAALGECQPHRHDTAVISLQPHQCFCRLPARRRA